MKRLKVLVGLPPISPTATPQGQRTLFQNVSKQCLTVSKSSSVAKNHIRIKKFRSIWCIERNFYLCICSIFS